jgi:hypothetical protein
MLHPEERHTSPDSCVWRMAVSRRRDRLSPARSVVGQFAKPGGDRSFPAGFGGWALLKLRSIERSLPLRWPQRGVPGGALETRHPGFGRVRHRGWLRLKSRSGTLSLPAPDADRDEDRA